jgi:hypothetical protein
MHNRRPKQACRAPGAHHQAARDGQREAARQVDRAARELCHFLGAIDLQQRPHLHQRLDAAQAAGRALVGVLRALLAVGGRPLLAVGRALRAGARASGLRLLLL